MKYLKKLETLPTQLEEGVLYYDSTNDKVALKKAKVVPEGFVDLGLPNGTLWATCNIGASKPEEYGKYFQWGDTVGYYDGQGAAEHSTWSTAPFNNNSSSYDSTYFASVSGDVCPNGVLALEYDAAYANTSGKQKMPTLDQIKELTANTTSTWVDNYEGSGVKGRLFTSKSDPTKSIFVPASGFFDNGSQYNVGSSGYVWSSSLFTGISYNAYYLYFGSDRADWRNYYRFNGFAVRGVLVQN